MTAPKKTAAENTNDQAASGVPKVSTLPPSVRVLTIAEVGEALSISPDQVMALIHTSQLLATNVSAGTRRTRLRVSVKELERFIEARTIKPPHLSGVRQAPVPHRTVGRR